MAAFKWRRIIDFVVSWISASAVPGTVAVVLVLALGLPMLVFVLVVVVFVFCCSNVCTESFNEVKVVDMSWICWFNNTIISVCFWIIVRCSCMDCVKNISSRLVLLFVLSVVSVASWVWLFPVLSTPANALSLRSPSSCSRPPPFSSMASSSPWINVEMSSNDMVDAAWICAADRRVGCFFRLYAADMLPSCWCEAGAPIASCTAAVVGEEDAIACAEDDVEGKRS